MIKIYLRDADRGGKSQSLLSDMVDGIVYTARHPGIAPLLILHIAAFIGGRAVFELMPGIAGEVFEGGPETLALLTSSIGIGAVFGGLWIAQRGRWHPALRKSPSLRHLRWPFVWQSSW